MNSRDNAELGLRLLRHMHRVRAVEEEIAERYPEGHRCPTHLSTGQEAVPAALAGVLSSDYAVSTHRGHAHYLAKVVTSAMIAEFRQS